MRILVLKKRIKISSLFWLKRGQRTNSLLHDASTPDARIDQTGDQSSELWSLAQVWSIVVVGGAPIMRRIMEREILDLVLFLVLFFGVEYG